MSKGVGVRARFATFAVRLVNLASKVTKRGSGTVAGGRMGLLIDPHLLRTLSRNKRVVLVSGTNGKTTTTALLRAGIGTDVISNTTGANMLAGHVAAFAAAPKEFGTAVLEVDEAWLARTAEETSPRALVLLNLSRDQLDRVSEVRQIAQRWRSMCAELDAMCVVVANADDPLVVWAALEAKNVVWVSVAHQWNLDSASCPVCTLPLTFEGEHWFCSCGFKKPEPDIRLHDQQIEIGESTYPLALSIPGSFNASNATLAVGALRALDVQPDVSLSRMNAVHDVAGRFSERMWQGRRITLALAKNPAGFMAMLSTLDAGESFVAIGINDEVADGRDPSWLYDVPFEILQGKTVYCFGSRSLDLATRLDYAGVSFTLNEADWPTSTTVPLIANYTSFRSVLEGSDNV